MVHAHTVFKGRAIILYLCVLARAHTYAAAALAESASLMLHRAAAKFKALRHKRRHAIPDVPVMPDVAMTDAVQPVLPQISAWRAPVCHGEPMLACRRLIENSQAQV